MNQVVRGKECRERGGRLGEADLDGVVQGVRECYLESVLPCELGRCQ